ncbi:MAG: DUF2203 domain-containing protein, partial [Candidatus Binatia bacterium]
PVVRPLIGKILDTIQRLRAKSEMVIRDQGIDPDTPNLMSRLQENEEIAGFVKQINESVNEIQRHGCMCKGVEQGLLDFPCVLGKEVVFLCWQYGESSVTYWHRIEDGFAGRRLLLDPDESEPSGSNSLH